jgi:membrane protease YdiL (CAAX protease family)
VKLVTLLRNRVFDVYAAVYVLSVVLLVTVEGFPLAEALLILGIFGVGLTLLAYILCRRARPFRQSLRPGRAEMLLLLVCVLGVAAYLTFGFGPVEALTGHVLGQSELARLAGAAVRKLLFLVVVPAVVFGALFKYSLRDYGLQFDGAAWRSHVPVLAGMVLVLVLFQYFLGVQAGPVRRGEFSAGQLAVGLPVVYLWLVVEVGLVEEFFFRALLQSRLAAYFKSELSGVLLASLVFGLAHAPGIYLRGAEAITPGGGPPSLVGSVCYSIAILSVTGFFLGLVWARTRNLLLVMLIHAAGDLLPNFAQLAGALGVRGVR